MSDEIRLPEEEGPANVLAAPPRFLMLTHDQDIDRRILQQAQSLMQRGWTGAIVCLSHGGDDQQSREEELEIIRIGLSKIVPPCPVYHSYQRRQLAVLKWFYTRPHGVIKGRWPRLMRMVDFSFKNVSRVNSQMYRMHLYAYYQNLNITCPLPFDGCFYNAARERAADIIIAHDLPALPAAVRLAEQWKVPLVYDAHELYYEQKAFSRRQKRMMRRTESALIHRCAATFTVNQSIAEEFARRYRCPQPGVLLNALDPAPPATSSGGSHNLREHLGIPAQQRILLFQGGLLRNRNLENLVRGIGHAQSRDFTAVFMGNGPLREPLEALAARFTSAGRIRFVSAVPPSELLEWTASADVGIIPYPSVDLNTHFCTPNKLFEYIQAGLPILANDLPELRRYVRDTGFGDTAPMTSARAIGVAIDQFFANPKLLESARQNIQRRRGEFSWSQASREYVHILEDLVHKSVRGVDSGEAIDAQIQASGC